MPAFDSQSAAEAGRGDLASDSKGQSSNSIAPFAQIASLSGYCTDQLRHAAKQLTISFILLYRG